MPKACFLFLLPVLILVSCQPKETFQPLAATTHAENTIIAQDYKPGYIEKCILCSDGSILACGKTQAGEPMLARLSLNMGVVYWSKVYSEAECGEFTDIAQLPSGHFVICGMKRGPQGSYRVLITHVSEVGELMWHQETGKPNEEINGRFARINSDNSFVIVAAQKNATYDLLQIFASSDTSERVFTETLKRAGEQIPYSAIKTLTGENIVTGTDNVSITSQDKMLLVTLPGYSIPGGVNVSTHINGGHTIARHSIELPGSELLTCGSVAHNGKVNGFICKSGNSFQQLWNAEFEADNNLILSSVIADGKDGFIAIGYVYGDADNDSKCIVIATGPDGKERLRKVYDTPEGSADKPVSLLPTPLGGYILLCNNNESITGSRYYMMHIDRSGDLVKH